ncbi:MAG TPA: DUF1810 domain-containing protein [Flavobacterium sp.]|nr:DUF1810 domain-containing protein [Flavobacterium sp.]
MEDGLNRFLKAQEINYKTALAEIKSSRKRSHWMWYIFPQLKGLGVSETSKYFGIKDLYEAKEYLNHPILGARLKEITNELLTLNESNPKIIFGSPDDKKLKSCMTLFSMVDDSNNCIFIKIIQKFFDGNFDVKTLILIENI